MDAFRLTFGVILSDGREIRWAADETDPAKQPQGFTFDTTNPGGFGKFGLTLSRDLIPQDDEELLSSLMAWGPGGEVAFEGRITRFPRSQGDAKTVTVEGVGWSSHLSDFRAFREIYRDTLAGNWLTAPSNLRRNNLLNGSPTKYILEGQTEAVIDPPGTGIDPNDLLPCVKQSLTSINGGESGTTYGGATDCRSLVESWYDAGAIAIGSVWYSVGTGQNSGSSMSGTDWVVALLLSDDHVHTNTQSTGDLDGGGTGTLTASSPTKRWATLQLYYTGGGGAAGEWHADWHLAVYGNHGLTKRGTEPTAGFYCSDIVTDAITRAAPLLNIGTLEDSGFVIQQMQFRDATTAGQVVLEANKTQQYGWFVWEDRTFTMLNPDPDRLCWRARLEAGAEITAEGEDAVKLASGIYVYYTDQWGQPRVYGPTGAEDCTATDDRLVGDGTDPYSKHGIAGPMTVTLDSPCTDDIALELGAVLLAENNAAARSGTIKIQGYVEHPTEGLVPSWRVRAGDYIQIVDLPGDTPRPIVQTSYNHAAREVSCTVANGALYRADALLARMAMNLGILG